MFRFSVLSEYIENVCVSLFSGTFDRENFHCWFFRICLLDTHTAQLGYYYVFITFSIMYLPEACLTFIFLLYTLNLPKVYTVVFSKYYYFTQHIILTHPRCSPIQVKHWWPHSPTFTFIHSLFSTSINPILRYRWNLLLTLTLDINVSLNKAHSNVTVPD